MDPADFARLYRNAYSRLWLIAISITGDRTYAEDIVQDSAITAFQKIDDFRPGTKFDCWVAEIVRRRALNYARKVKTRRTVPADPNAMDQTNMDGRSSSGATPFHGDGTINQLQTDFDDKLVHALNSLSSDARCCLLLRVVEQMSYEDISQLLQMPAGTAMSHVHRSKAAMRKLLVVHPTQDSDGANA